MANIKFSAFTQKVVQTNVDFLVGYTGADNVRITPAALGDGIYLPLGGGTMVGDVTFNDNVDLYLGTGNDFQAYHDGSNTYLRNLNGDFIIKQDKVDADLIFQNDDGAGGTETYLTLDGGDQRIKIPDAKIMQFGAGGDLQIQHDAVNSLIRNYTGDLIFTNYADDKDIIFQSDDGSGGIETYFYLDGSANRNVSNKNFRIIDNKKLTLGSSDDLEIYHDGSNSFIRDTGTGDLKIQSNRLWFQSSLGETMGRLTENGSAELYYDNALKLGTTNTGIQVTDEVSIGTSLVHTGDTDTKVSFGTDEIVLTTAGTDAVTVDSSQNATFAASVKYNGELQVFSGATDIGQISNLSGALNIQGTGTRDVSLGSDTVSQAVFIEGTNGNVGIGTSPSHKLDVRGASAVSMIRTPDTTAPTLGLFVNDGSNGVGTISVDNGGHMTFDTGSTGAGQAEKMRITAAGEVGINITPVANYALTAKSLIASGTYTILAYNSDGERMAGFYQTTTKDGELYLKSDGDVSKVKLSSITDSYLNGGNVGIGTAAPTQKTVIVGPSTSPDLSSAVPADATLLLANSDPDYGTYFGTMGTGVGLIQQRRQNAATFYNLALQPYGGDVGIGIAAPLFKLHTYRDDATATPSVTIENDGTGDASIHFLLSGIVGWSAGLDNSDGDKFKIHNSQGFSGSFFTIDGAGDVGIGTSTPTAALQVVGLAEHADNAAALLAGLTAGAFYRTGDLLKVVH